MRNPQHPPEPIGGYFELELPARHGLPHSLATRFQSARAAFSALLQAYRPERVWLPKYICNAMADPLRSAAVECVWYDVDDRLCWPTDLAVGTNDWLLYVDYFGVCSDQVATLLQRFAPDQIILDYSQSFYMPAADVLATIYSPRKFFGVPDGGMIHSRFPIPAPKIRDTGSIERTSHLIRRLAEPPESGYADYQRAEASLSEYEPKSMSALTERILCSIDFDQVARKRRENFRLLHQILGEHNLFPLAKTDYLAPLCYPFRSRDPDLRNRLIRNRIFVPTYWPDAISRLPPRQVDSLVRCLLPLPIDQRYGSAEMERIAATILNGIK